MGRRGFDEGSIYKRKDGLWVGQYRVEIEGRVKRKYIYGRDRKDVAKRLGKAIAERNEGLVYHSGAMNLETFLKKWLGYMEGGVRFSTHKRYETACRIHIVPSLGTSRLERLSPLQLNDFYREKLSSGLSARSVQILHATLHKALGEAVQWLLIPRNTASLASPPRYIRKEINPLTEDQARKLLETVRGDALEALYVLANTTGMRQGELLGLKWEDVDLTHRIVRVRRAINAGIVNPPKTKSGTRSISLSRRAVESLTDHRGGVDGSSWVFSSRTGEPLRANNLCNRHWKSLLQRAGLPRFRFHDLRHTCATLLLVQGVHPKVVQEMLGHANIGITLDTYSHVLPGMQEKAVEAIDAIL